MENKSNNYGKIINPYTYIYTLYRHINWGLGQLQPTKILLYIKMIPMYY